jgi:hypothetical protein
MALKYVTIAAQLGAGHDTAKEGKQIKNPATCAGFSKLLKSRGA